MSAPASPTSQASPDAAQVAQVDALLVPLAAHGLAGSMFEMPRSSFAPDEWFALVRTCQTYGLVGMLAVAAQRDDITLSPAQAEELAVLENEAAGLALLVEQRVVRLSALLAAAGVEHRLLGAPPRSRLGYRQAGIRTFETATMLVEPGGLDVAVPRGVTVHQVMRVAGGRAIDISQLSQPPTSLSLADHVVPTASLEEHLVLACLDLAPPRSGDEADLTAPRDLVTRRDVAELALSKEIDPARVQHTAEAWSVVNHVARALAQVWELFGLADRTRLSVWAHRIADPPAPVQRNTGTAAPRETHRPRHRAGMVGRLVHKVQKLAPSKVAARAAARRSK